MNLTLSVDHASIREEYPNLPEWALHEILQWLYPHHTAKQVKAGDIPMKQWGVIGPLGNVFEMDTLLERSVLIGPYVVEYYTFTSSQWVVVAAQQADTCGRVIQNAKWQRIAWFGSTFNLECLVGGQVK